MGDSHNSDRAKPASSGHPSMNGHRQERPRPPGTEEKHGATATSHSNKKGKSRWRLTPSPLRTIKFWLILAGLLLLNYWVIVPWLFPAPQDRVNVPYTFFKQQVVAGNVADITGQGQELQGDFKRPVADPTSPGLKPIYFKSRSPSS